MTRLIEDCLTEDEERAIEAVLSSNELRFDRLVQLAGLDPASDFAHTDLRDLNFCGADLRGFDFTGSDLRGCAKDERTLIDSTTLLDGAKINWVEARDIPIVQLMREVEVSTSSEARAKSLSELESKFGKTEHVVSFVVNAANAADTMQSFLDYVDFLPADLDPHQLYKVIEAGERLLTKKFAKSRSRTRREATTIFAATTIAERLSQAQGSLAAEWYKSLAEVVDTEKTNDALKGTSVRFDKKELWQALESLYQKSS